MKVMITIDSCAPDQQNSEDLLEVIFMVLPYTLYIHAYYLAIRKSTYDYHYGNHVVSMSSNCRWFCIKFHLKS